MDLTAIIPARGGSKGIIKKNIYPLNSKPLISYTIEAAKASRFLNRIIVSTDDEEIARISKREGAEVIERPASLAGDKVTTVDAVIHVVKEMGIEGTVIVLQPTSPLRTSEDIDNAVELFRDTPEADSLVSVTDFPHPPFWALKIEGGRLKPLFNHKYLQMRRQDLERAYIPNGAIFIGERKTLEDRRTFYTENTIPYYMPPERSIDIDTLLDLKIAETIMKETVK